MKYKLHNDPSEEPGLGKMTVITWSHTGFTVAAKRQIVAAYVVCRNSFPPKRIRVSITEREGKVRLRIAPLLQTHLLICTVAKDIYEFLAGDPVK